MILIILLIQLNQMAILLMNVFAPLVDHYVIGGNIKKRLNRVKG